MLTHESIFSHCNTLLHAWIWTYVILSGLKGTLSTRSQYFGIFFSMFRFFVLSFFFRHFVVLTFSFRYFDVSTFLFRNIYVSVFLFSTTLSQCFSCFEISCFYDLSFCNIFFFNFNVSRFRLFSFRHFFFFFSRHFDVLRFFERYSRHDIHACVVNKIHAWYYRTIHSKVYHKKNWRGFLNTVIPDIRFRNDRRNRWGT